MSTPIRREDIRKGDRIRKVVEFTSGENRETAIVTLELIERPVVPPTEYGLYQIDNGMVLEFSGVGWRSPNLMHYMNMEAGKSRSFTLLRPVAEVAAEVAAEVLAEVHGLFGTPAFVHADIDAIAVRWATK